MRTLEQRLAALEANQPPTTPALITSNYVAREWQTLLISAPSTGEIRINLPKATQQNRGAVVWLAFLTTGAVRLVASGGTVNGVAAGITNNTVGTYTAVSDGHAGWLVLPGVADGSIPHSKLADLAAYSVLGRSANSAGAMAAITAGTAGHHLVRNGSTDLRFASPAGADMDLATDGKLTLKSFTGDVTKAAGGTALTIATGAVTPAKLSTGVVIVSGGGPHNDVALAANTVAIRVETTSTITGFTGGFDGRSLLLYSVNVTPTLGHATGSAVGNQINCPTNANVSLGVRGGAVLFYDNGGWRVAGSVNS